MSQSVARTWALFGAVVIVSACGGGGSDGGAGGGGNAGAPPAAASPTPSPSPSPSPAPSPSAPEEFLVGGIGRSNGVQTLVIADPAQPSAPRWSTAVDSYLETSHVAFDAAGRRGVLGGNTTGFYTRSGQVFQVSLRKSQTTQGQRISSLTTACEVRDWHPLSFNSGDDGWVELTEAGPDLQCATSGDNRQVFVRHGTPPTAAATFLPSGVKILLALPDPASSALLGFIAHDSRTTPGKLAFYDSSLAYVSDVASGIGTPSLELLSFRPGSFTTSAYVRYGVALLRLDWSSTSAQLSSMHYWFSGSGDSGPRYLSDSAAMYFVDGLAVRRIDATDTISTVATMDAANGTDVSFEGLTSGHLVIRQQPSSGDPAQLFTVPKLGGTPLRIGTAGWRTLAVGVTGDEVVYTTVPTYGVTGDLRRVRADGSNDRRIAFSYSGNLMPVFSTTTNYLSGGTLDGLMACVLTSPSGDCFNGSLRYYDLQSGSTTVLGTFSHGGGAQTSLNLGGRGYSGRPGVFTTSSTVASQTGFVQDAYLVTPGAANSLARLTLNIP